LPPLGIADESLVTRFVHVCDEAGFHGAISVLPLSPPETASAILIHFGEKLIEKHGQSRVVRFARLIWIGR
jgi:hypothetical protein